MYSYDDRLRAVQLYIKLGKRIGVTIRQLGRGSVIREGRIRPPGSPLSTLASRSDSSVGIHERTVMG